MSDIQEAAAIPSARAAAPRTRMAALDICRGLAILTVLFIHVSNHFLRPLHVPDSHRPLTWEWMTLAVPNQDAQWAVPCFLMLSAFVNALSLARGRDVGQYAKRRVQAALIPFLLWSLVYLALGWSSITSHSFLHLFKIVITGKAWYHLYFFALVLELYVLLPLLIPLFQRRPPFWMVALGAVTLQLALYYANRFVFYKAFNGTILWHILPVAIGLWLFSQSERMEKLLNIGRWGAGAAALLAMSVYTPIALHIVAYPHQKVNTFAFQAGEWIYTAGMSFLVLALAYGLGKNRLTHLLQFLGAESLAIYVMHPLAIFALDKLGLNKSLGVGAGFLIYYAACLALPLLAAWTWTQIRSAGGAARRPA